MKYISEFYEKYNGSQYQSTHSIVAGEEEGEPQAEEVVEEEEVAKEQVSTPVLPKNAGELWEQPVPTYKFRRF